MPLRILADLASGFGLLTRVPVGWVPTRPDRSDPGRAAWCFPLVGAVIGLAGAAVLQGGAVLRLPHTLSAWCAVAAVILLSGALHEDGLADTADGVGGGRDRAARLRIMRDSRIGSYGALALILSTGIRVAAIDTIPGPRVLAGLPCAAALGRAAMLVVVLSSRPARPDGFGRFLMTPGVERSAGIGCILAAAITLALLPIGNALMLAVLAGMAGLAMAVLGRRMLGGFTGDILGATSVLTECLLLAMLARS
ncbi:MAG: adenosylcobinamide-GDP ribazoletransferase [Gluconacetobacter diazotrophicus]|nr:adenosylcobinamide-GDP ribazoletransferase [Gluconacetobacter diazotrophicus]